ncbi:hypothetical protein AB0P21_16865 [Kribbella sp. NPDC056861]|uniref:hypothetical protein n=1 Tax=Kribbella sp. NPDC056861 TaxID=3154857 RepID=UPI00344707DB
MQRKRVLALAAIAVLAVGFTPAANAIAELAVAEGDPVVKPGSPVGRPADLRQPPDAAGNIPADPNEGAARSDIASLNQKYALTAAQRAQGDTILRNSPILGGTFKSAGGVPYTIDQTGAWRDDDTGVMHGAIYDITLSRPISTTMVRLPVLAEDGGPSTIQVKLTNVEKFTMIVSFDTQTVVEVDPVATDGSTFVPGPEMTPRPTPTGDGDQ